MFFHARFGVDSGQASVELVAALPVLAVALLCAWQAVVAGHSVWTVAEAARVAAREYSVQRRSLGDHAARARARSAADRVLPRKMRAGRRITVSPTGVIALRARVPLAPPFAAVFGRGPAIDSRARFQR